MVVVPAALLVQRVHAVPPLLETAVGLHYAEVLLPLAYSPRHAYAVPPLHLASLLSFASTAADSLAVHFLQVADEPTGAAAVATRPVLSVLVVDAGHHVHSQLALASLLLHHLLAAELPYLDLLLYAVFLNL